jgi:chromatin segregation and condensation protein Rec8/ScpA/Scc1 (kleisin family)
VVLQEIVRGTRDRVLVAVTFLAMLELVKRREIVVGQDEPWGPISVRLTTPDERRAAGVDDSLPDEPLDEALATFA